MNIGLVSLFPDMIREASAIGVGGRAIERGIVDLRVENPRDFAHDQHRTVDDRPYGGGPGMVLKVEPFQAAIDALKRDMVQATPVIFLSPQGRVFDQRVAEEFAALPGMILVAGRYEGFDQRLIDAAGAEELSLGDFVLSGGEIAALAVMDAVVRLLPGVLGDSESAEQDSFADGLLDCPHYTRPEDVAGVQVPPVLLDGNHEDIRRWRLKEALGRTWRRRPDLLGKRPLGAEEQALLDEFIEEQDSPG
ncbi:MAG: tRNA (guanosine(37)-N1)-methyltransferase TrmD [Gammaproteobacteria bacterium]